MARDLIAQDHRQGDAAAELGGGFGGSSPRMKISSAECLDRWAMNPMAMNVATGTFHRAVRVSETSVSVEAGSGLSKSALSRRFKALTQATFD